MQELTEEKKRELKAKYGTLFLLEVEDKQCILKTPDRKTLAMAQSIGKQNPLKFNEILLKNCWVDGDEEIKKDDALFLAACQKLDEIIEVKDAYLTKL